MNSKFFLQRNPGIKGAKITGEIAEKVSEGLEVPIEIGTTFAKIINFSRKNNIILDNKKIFDELVQVGKDTLSQGIGESPKTKFALVRIAIMKKYFEIIGGNKVFYTRNFIKDLEKLKLKSNFQATILEKIDAFAHTHTIEDLRSNSRYFREGKLEIRLKIGKNGTYRIFGRLDDKNQRLIINQIFSKKDIATGGRKKNRAYGRK